LTLIHAMVAGATHIDHANMLRAGSTASVLPHRVMAPSTLGDVPARVQFRSRSTIRKSDRGHPHSCVESGGGPGEQPTGGRHRLDDP
jgi:hypothetical protein